MQLTAQNMKREIKFRVYNPRTGMSDPIRMDFAHGLRLIGDAEKGREDVSDDKSVLMQFTGLKDASGNDIYEGDILLDDAEGNTYDFVEWNKELGGWGTSVWYGTKDLVESASLHEIAGNIYENPEIVIAE